MNEMAEIGSSENRAFFLESAKAKSINHQKISVYWGRVNKDMGYVMIILSSLTALLTALPMAPKLLTVIVSGLLTLLSAVKGFLQPDKRRHTQVRCLIQLVSFEISKDCIF